MAVLGQLGLAVLLVSFIAVGKKSWKKIRTKRLFDNNPALVGWVVDDGGCDEESLSVRNVLATSGDLVLVLGHVLEESLDALVLHRVLNWSEVDALVIWSSDLEVVGKLGHGLESLLVDGFVDIDTLGGNAHLSAVLEGAEDQLRSDGLHIDVGHDDGGVVAAELEGYTLQGRGASGHDLLAGCNGTGEGDLGDAWVLCHHRTEFVVASQDLDDSWWEDLLGELDTLEDRVWCERRWL